MNANRRLFSLLLSTSIFLLACTTYKAGIATDIIFKDVNVISMTSESIDYQQSVLISDGVIQFIGDFDEILNKESCLVLDCSEQYLVPGFSDMHVHTYNDEELLLFLANGVTKVRNMYGYPYHLRNQKLIREKELLGPELITTSPIIDGKDPIWPGSYIISSPDRVERALFSLKRKGYDSFKVYERLSNEVFLEILNVAQKMDMRVVGHIPENVDIKDALSLNMTSIEHLDGYDHMDNEELIDLTIENHIWNCPTLYVLDIEEKLFSRELYPDLFSIEKNESLQYVNPQTMAFWERAKGLESHFDERKELLSRIHKRGGKIISGTDQLNPYVVPGFSLHEEFKLLHDCGLSPYDILQTTTVNPAEMLGISHRAGTIETGKDADLVLLRENPLIHIENTKSIEGVMVKGLWLSEQVISNMLAYVKDRYH